MLRQTSVLHCCWSLFSCVPLLSWLHTISSDLFVETLNVLFSDNFLESLHNKVNVQLTTNYFYLIVSEILKVFHSVNSSSSAEHANN